MATFVLVHGMWAGGWYWQQVAPLLRAAGQDVLTPTLTGLGERSHLARPDVDLETHVADIENVLVYEDLHDVILVGHSYAGMIVRGVADRAAERLRMLVYLDAFVPQDGERVLDIWPAAYRPDFEAMAAGLDGWRIPTLDPGDEDPEIVAWEAGRATPHPIATFRTPIRLAHEVPLDVAQVFIHCTDKPDGDPFGQYAAMAQASDEWEYQTIDAVHDVMAVRPGELTVRLLALA